MNLRTRLRVVGDAPLRAVAVVAATTLLVACGDDDTPSDQPGDTTVDTGAGVANPASEFCVEQGGTVEIVSEQYGQVGYCNLPDGTRVEEWEYFRSANTTP